MSAEIVVAPAASEKLPVGAIYRKRTAFSRKLRFFQRDAQRLRDLLQKLKDDKEAPEVKNVSEVVLGYRLVRNVALTHNWCKMSKGDDKRVVPEEYAKEIETIYGADVSKKVGECLKMTSAEVVEVLPTQLDEKVTKAVLAFCDQKEKVIIADLEKVIEDCSKEIEARKDEPKPPRKKQPKSPKAVKKGGDAPEEKFRDLIIDVRAKVKKIKLSSGGYEVYAQTQEQIDSLLYEATEEIMKIKKTLKDRFERVQRSKSNSKSRSRVRRSRSKDAKKVVEVEA